LGGSAAAGAKLSTGDTLRRTYEAVNLTTLFADSGRCFRR